MKTYKSPPIHRTPLYRAKSAYTGMLSRCENSDGKNPSYSKVKLKMSREEFLVWAIPKYEEFLKNNPGGSPHVARFGDKGDYEIGNIEIISSEENRSRQTPLESIWIYTVRKYGLEEARRKWSKAQKSRQR